MDGQDTSYLERPTQPTGCASRDTTVLLASITPPERRATSGQGLKIFTDAVELSGGRVVRNSAGEVLALFRSPDNAALAAIRMQNYATTAAERGGTFAVRVAFQHGPLGQRNDDVFGETVNLAIQLLDEAKNGQVLTTEETAGRLAPPLQDLTGCMAPGSSTRRELLWQRPNVFPRSGGTSNPCNAGNSFLRLSYAGKAFFRRRQGDSITIGRDPECGVGVAARTASRRHCTIVQTPAGFVLQDHSTNGTYLVAAGMPERRLLHEELQLPPRGILSFGEPVHRAEHQVQFSCE